MNASPLKVGLIGCGNISNAYFTGLALFPIVKVVGAADIVLARAEAKAKEHGVRAYTIEDLLADPAIDIVVNLTVPKVHASVNLTILESKKHAYSEKPFALDLAEGRLVLDLAQSSGFRVGCAPDTFLGGGIQTARKVIEDGLIGAPIGAVANMASHGPEGWHPDPEFFYQVGGGPMLDMGPYYLTALVNLLGPIRRATGSARASFHERIVGSGTKQGSRIKVEIPTHYAGVFDFASGPVAALNMSFDVWSHNLPIIEVYGTEGSLRVPDPNTFGGVVEVRRSEDKEWRQIPLTHSDQVRRGIGVADLATAVRYNRPHRASGELAYHVLEAMLSVQLASERGTHILLESTVAKPKALPVGLKFGELDQ
jgi:predicted dehydrogenase